MKHMALTHRRIAVMTLDKTLQYQFSDLASTQGLSLTVVNYHHLLAENYDVLIIDGRENRTLPQAIMANWMMPKILLTAGGKALPDNIGQFQAILLAADIADGLPAIINFAAASWQQERQLKNRLNDFEYQLGCRRFIVMAEMLMIRWFNCTEKDAWAMIRTMAMATQSKVEEVCIDMISSPEGWEKTMKHRFFNPKAHSGCEKIRRP